jgi:hypothetical protein
VGAASGGVGAYLSADALRYNQNKTGLSWPQAQSARVSASHELIGGECLIAAGAAAVLAGAGLWFFGRPGAAALGVTPAGVAARGTF